MISNKVYVIPVVRKQNNLNEPDCKSIEYQADDTGKKKSIAESIKNFVVFKPCNAAIFSNLKGLFGILILILTVATTTLVTCFPHHNAITHPEYWYESLYFLLIVLAPINSVKNIVEAKMLLSKRISFKDMIKSFIISLV